MDLAHLGTTHNALSRRGFLTVAGGVTAASLLSACGSPSSGGADGFTLWSQLAGSKKAAGNALETAFHSQSPKIAATVDLYGDPSQLNQKLLTSFAGGTVPDLVIQHWLYSVDYAAYSRLADLRPYMSSKGPAAASLDSGLLQFGTLDQVVFGLPMYGTSRGLTLNDKLVKKAGLDPDRPPTNWAELREWALAMTVRKNGVLQVAGLHTYTVGLDGWELFLLLLQGVDGSVLSADGKTVAFNNDQGVEALQFLVDLVIKDKVCDPGFGVGDQANAIPFLTDRAGMAVGGNFTINAANTAGVDMGLAPWPKQNGGYTTIVDPFCFSIPQQSKNKDAAYSFIEFALQQSQQVAFCGASRNLPALKAAQDDAKITANKQLAFFVDVAKYAPTAPTVVGGYSQIQTIVSSAVQNAVYGRASAKAALDSAASQVKTVLSSM